MVLCSGLPALEGKEAEAVVLVVMAVVVVVVVVAVAAAELLPPYCGVGMGRDRSFNPLVSSIKGLDMKEKVGPKNILKGSTSSRKSRSCAILRR